MPPGTQFYDLAVKAGFYESTPAGLFGKKDNVRRIWEDMTIKLRLRPYLEDIIASGRRLRVVDLGSGAGEGFELLTHVPARIEGSSGQGPEFVLSKDDIDSYVGLDLSRAMVAQGRRNYHGRSNVRFEIADLNAELPIADEAPFDVYFSSYGSFSHLSKSGLTDAVSRCVRHARSGSIVVLDLLGRRSLEWPRYWALSADEFLPYNMAYLTPPERRDPERIQWFRNSFWTGADVHDAVRDAAGATGRAVAVEHMSDRSIFVGRHIETGLFGGRLQRLRHQVNRLLDHGYRGRIDELHVDRTAVDELCGEFPQVCRRLGDYAGEWNAVVDLLEELMTGDKARVSALIRCADPGLAEDLVMLKWLAANAHRFPVADFWASIMGPQVAIVLRSREMALPEGIGCGHGLFAVLRVGA